jgi:hypothetical protein
MVRVECERIIEALQKAGLIKDGESIREHLEEAYPGDWRNLIAMASVDPRPGKYYKALATHPDSEARLWAVRCVMDKLSRKTKRLLVQDPGWIVRIETGNQLGYKDRRLMYRIVETEKNPDVIGAINGLARNCCCPNALLQKIVETRDSLPHNDAQWTLRQKSY